jgi:O-antigen ligase
MFLCVPFSFWKGKSFLIAFGYWRNDLLIMFMIAGLAVSWREVQFLGKAIAVAAFVNVLTSRIFAHEGAAGRLRMDFGAVSNANDFAAHLLLTLPFLILMISNSKRIVVKAAALLLLGVGVIVIVKTGSRGALLALVADCLFVMLRGNNRQRIALMCLAPVTVVAVLAFVPTTVLQRIRSFSSSEAGASAEALESSQSRRYLLTKAIRYAVEFPLFGLGPGQFIEYEGSHNKVIGQHGMYHDPHNSFVQAFAEMGVPGGILLIAAYVSSFLMVSRTYRLARQRPDCVDIRNTTFCIMLGMVGFCIAITFLNFTYFFYGPALGGMAVSVWRAANYEFKTRTPQPVNGASVLGANRFRAAAAAGN